MVQIQFVISIIAIRINKAIIYIEYILIWLLSLLINFLVKKTNRNINSIYYFIMSFAYSAVSVLHIELPESSVSHRYGNMVG